MRQGALAALVMVLGACASRADVESDPPDAAFDVRRAQATTADGADASEPWPATTPASPPPAHCPRRPSADACRPGGFMCDVVHGEICCGSCLDGMCCSAREQECSDVGGIDTCCAGLRCSSRCICE